VREDVMVWTMYLFFRGAEGCMKKKRWTREEEVSRAERASVHGRLVGRDVCVVIPKSRTGRRGSGRPKGGKFERLECDILRARIVGNLDTTYKLDMIFLVVIVIDSSKNAITASPHMATNMGYC
jgi:hypothetical protein